MNFFRNVTIYQKISLIVTISIATVLVVMLLNTNMLKKVVSEFDDLKQVEMQVFNITAKMKGEIFTLQNSFVFDSVLDLKQTKSPKHRKLYREIHRDMDKMIELSKKLKDSKLHDLSKRLKVRIDRLYEVGKKFTGTKVFTSNWYFALDEFFAIYVRITKEFDELYSYTKNNFDTRVSSFSRFILDEMFTINMLGTIGLIVLIILTIYVAIKIVSSIKQLLRATKNLSKKEPDLSTRLMVTSNDELGDVIKYFNVFIDNVEKMDEDLKNQKLTVEKNAEELGKYLEVLSEYKKALDASSIVVRLDASQNVIYVNSEFTRISSYDKDELLGSEFKNIIDLEEMETLWKKANDKIHRGEIFKGEIKMVKKDGDPFWVISTITPTISNERKVTGFTIIMQDITYRVLAITDPLTKIYNRLKLDESLTALIQHSKENGVSLSLIMFDIDHFKRVNDTYGHKAGDYVLVEISKLVKDNIRPSDVFARWGGEEFMIVATDTNVEGATILSEKIREKIDNHYFEEVEHVTISMGVTQLKENDDRDTIIERVDSYLYKAKGGGRNQVINN